MLKTGEAAVARVSEAGDEKELRNLLADLVSLVEPRLLELWRSTGMTFTQRRLLRRLSDGPRSAGALATELGVPAPSLTRHLQRLEDHRLITREVDRGDRRRVVVALTPAGHGALSDRTAYSRSPLAAAVSAMPPTRQRELARSLRLLIQLAREQEGVSGDD